MELEAKEWHDVEIDLDSVEDGTNDRGWNCYFATINGTENEEIPFWAMRDFYAFYESLSPKVQKKTIEVQFRRKIVNGKNTAEFRSE